MFLGWLRQFQKRVFFQTFIFLVTGVAIVFCGSASSVRASLDDGLVGYWTFDEGSGATVADSSGFGNHVMVDGVPDWVDGPVGGGFQFNGSTQLDPVATNSIPIGNSSYTIATWFRATAPAMRGFVGWGEYGSMNQVNAFRLADEGQCPENGGINNYWWGNDLIACGSASVIDNQWHHAAVTYDGITRRLYIDGVQMASDLPGVHIVPNTANFAIGKTAPMFSEFLVGGMDDLRIYNRGLSGMEINSLFETGDSTPPTVPSSFNVNVVGSTVFLTWINPIIDFHSVALRRSTSGFPSSVTEGTAVTSSYTGTSFVESGLENGVYYYGLFARDASGNFSSAATSTMVVDTTSPLIVSVTSTAGMTTTTVTWTTDELTSSQVVYGPNTRRSSSTAEGDVSPRVLSHSVLLERLTTCTLYHYKVVARDLSGNQTTSVDATFTTTGCPGNAPVAEIALEEGDTSATTTVSLVDEDHAIRLEVPAGFTSVSSSITFQVKSLDMTAVLNGIGRPSATLYQASPVVFDLQALINAETTLDTFDSPIVITYRYALGDITGLRESTLQVYHYHRGMWVALDGCIHDTNARTITCLTRGFSTFGLFGQAQQVEAGGLAVMYGCTDRSALNYLPEATIANVDSCRYSASTSSVMFPIGVPLSPATLIQKNTPSSSHSFTCVPTPYPTKPIRYGMKNDPTEVKRLEQFLNASDGKRRLTVDGIYSKTDRAAVIAWQEKYAKDVLKPWGLVKGTGHILALSLRKMDSLQKSACN